MWLEIWKSDKLLWQNIYFWFFWVKNMSHFLIKTYLTNLLVLGLAGGSNGLQCACSPPTSCGGNPPLTFGEWSGRGCAFSTITVAIIITISMKDFIARGIFGERLLILYRIWLYLCRIGDVLAHLFIYLTIYRKLFTIFCYF